MQISRLSLFTFAVAASASLVLAEERSFDLSGFDGVRVSEGIHMVVTAGSEFAVTAESSEAAQLDRLELDVRRNTLHADMDRRAFSLRRTKGWMVTVSVSMPALVQAEASSGAELRANQMIGEDLDLEASSGASLFVNRIEAEAVKVDASSGARAEIEGGTCERIDANASSGAAIDIGEVKCERARVDASSGARIDLMATVAVDASASSGASITVYGNPGKTDIDASSSGSVLMR
ncbi:MAG: DUF2807 domain-containing protein [Alphaproteobacteria bacterium]|nr:DUF2807 domain-containing protein [Alphaproteobacteria bacterium]NNF24511.1 DUF2807 domain-containing protein [Paracoccaceae bacterium]